QRRPAVPAAVATPRPLSRDFCTTTWDAVPTCGASDPSGVHDLRRTDAPMPAHILIVDDDPEVLDVLREMVASLGYNVSTASNGAEALAAVLALQPDALMTDLAMPAMSGLELIARVKAARPQVPVIVTAAAIE